MCGISGLISSDTLTKLKSDTELMTARLIHRGPDSQGIHVEAGVGFGHRRLSVMDVSENGQQPMISACGRYVMVYNGEIYNHKELLSELDAFTQRGHSDTEVILEYVSQRGVESTLQKINGMFAIAIWDRNQRRLHLIRDRLGIKPIYWSHSTKGSGSRLLFCSELKAMRALPDFDSSIDQSSVAEFLRYNCVGGEKTIYKNVKKLLPGHHLIFSERGELTIGPYWVPPIYKPMSVDRAEIVHDLAGLIEDAVKLRMVSDVPLGAFLSGGIDSSLVTALMQKNSSSRVKTFTIGFENSKFDESSAATEVANHLKTDHTGLLVTAEQARNVIPSIADMYDEPFADISQIPTFLISQLTRKTVTVALSGDGGDELFAGYNRHVQAQHYLKHLWKLPASVRYGLKSAINSVPMTFWRRLFQLPGIRSRLSLPEEKIGKFAEVLSCGPKEYYDRVRTHWAENIVLGHPDVASKGLLSGQDFVADLQQLDVKNYLPDDILTKVDRASMAVSLEVRVPLLDHRIVEYSRQIPTSVNIRNGQGKWPLRQILNEYVPEEKMDGPKRGFSVPIGEWLRGPLAEWAGDQLTADSINRRGILDSSPIIEKWEQHKRGTHDWHYQLWNVLVLQAWFDRWM